jgi:hypothetical protein
VRKESVGAGEDGCLCGRGREKARNAAGVTNGRVLRSAEDPNDVLILQDVADVAKARAWLGGDELKAAMTKAGVVGSPNLRFAS